MVNSSGKTKAAPPARERRHESGATVRAVPHADALAAVRRRMGSVASGPATDEEREAIKALMVGADYEAEFRSAPIDYEGKAGALGMSADELRDLIKKK